MPADDNKNLEKFIQRVLEIQNSPDNNVLKTDDLHKIAMEMGLTESEWEELSKTFNNHVIRAKGYIQHQLWEMALKELEQAHTLNPCHADTLYGIALCYKGLYDKKKKNLFKEQAVKYAQNCLNVEPAHTKALQLISNLENPEQQSSTPKKPVANQRHHSSVSQQKQAAPVSSQRQRKVKIAVLLGVFLLVGLGLAVYSLWRVPSAPEMEYDYPTANEQTSESTSSSSSSDDQSPQLPVVFVDSDRAQGLSLEVELSELSDYTDSYSYTFKGLLHVENIEVYLLKLKFELLNNKGQVIHSAIEKVVDDHEPTALNGDLIPVDFLEYQKNSSAPDLSEVRVSVDFIEKEQAPPSYEPSKKLPIEWAAERPSNYNVEVRMRLSSLKHSYKEGFYHKLALEVENTGNRSIEQMQIQMQWLNKQGEVKHTNEVYITISSYPKIKRGETRVYGGTYNVQNLKKEDYGEFRVKILSVE